MAESNRLTRNPARWEALRVAVEEGWSYNEIRRTLGVDHRTVKAYYPDYKPFPVGGAGMAATLRRANQVIDNAELKGTK